MKCSMDGTPSHPGCLIMQVYDSTILEELAWIMELVSLDFLWIGGCYIYFLTIDVFIASWYDHGIPCIVYLTKIEI